MKSLKLLLLAFAVVFASSFTSINAQEEESSESPFSVGADLVSSYVWRGVKYGGPSLQPYVEYGVGGFAIGAWGSFGIGPVAEAVNEADLYLGYGFDFGLYLGLTDYWYQGTSYGAYSFDTAGAHVFEINAAYEIGGFSIAGNYIINESMYSEGGDVYFEAGYSFEHFGVFVGAGDGWHTSTGEFGVCNVGITASKEIQFTEKFSLPVGGLVSVNPQLEEFNIVATISF